MAIEGDRRWCDTNVKRSTRQNIQTIQETQVHEKTTSFNKGARRTNSPYRIRIGQCDTPPVILKRETKKAEEQGMARDATSTDAMMRPMLEDRRHRQQQEQQQTFMTKMMEQLNQVQASAPSRVEGAVQDPPSSQDHVGEAERRRPSAVTQGESER